MRCKQKILALLLAVALVLAMSSTALAEGGVCMIGDTPYNTLQAAVDAVPKDATTPTTITLLDNTAGGGVKVESGKNIIFDLDDYTYTVTGPLVGSSGTVTNGFQLLRDSTIKIQNGKIDSTAAGLKILIQNYANLTLNNVILDGSKALYCDYVCSNNFGTVDIIGNTSILAKEDAVAFDVYYWPDGGYGDVIVNVNTTGTIDGKIEYGSDITGKKDVAKMAKLNIQKGTFTGEISTYNLNEDNDTGIVISGGTFSDTSTITPYLAPGLELVPGASGQFVVKKASSHDDGDDSSIGYPPPAILSPTGNQVVAVMANGTVTLSVDATGVGFGGYQWYVNRGDGLGFVPVAGATGYSLTLYPTFADNGSQYYCRVMNGYGFVDSGCFTLSVVGGMVPKTGDQVSVTLWVCLMALGVAGAAAALARRRSR
mgnify:CR=1 FL=1